MTPATQAAIEECYSALLEPARWSCALQSLAESLGATSCVVRRSDFRVQEMDLSGFDSDEHTGFTELWLDLVEGAPDPHCERAAILRNRGHVVVLEHQISSEEERSRQPYYREIAVPGDRFWWAQIGFETSRNSWYLPLFRRAAADPFDPVEAQGLAELAPKLRSLFELVETLSQATIVNSLKSFDLLGRAVVLIDWNGHATHVNQHAERLLDLGLTLANGRLGARDIVSNGDLRALISDVTRHPPNFALPSQPVVVRRDGAPWLLVEATPVTSTLADVFSSGHSLLILTDLTDGQLPTEAVLRAVFQLTPAQARVAQKIATGDGLAAAAAALGVSIETARSHLRVVFAKTGTRRQAQLAVLLNRLPSCQN